MRFSLQLAYPHALCAVHGCGHRFTESLDLEVYATEGQWSGQKLGGQAFYVCEMHHRSHQRALDGEEGFYPDFELWADEHGVAHLQAPP